MKIGSRQPTVDEAVDLILRSKTRHFRRLQLDFWREKFGDMFASTVEAKVRAAWGRK